MQLVLLLVLSTLVILFSVLGGRARRKRSEQRYAPKEAIPPQTTRPPSAIWSSPVWNVVGVLAGVVGAVVAVVGLIT
jgi:hypothetical protein